MTFLRIVIRSSRLFEHDLFGKPAATFPDRALRHNNPLGLMPALVAFEDANFRPVLLSRIGRAANQMRIAAAFAAANRSNKGLFLDDEGTFLHSQAPTPGQLRQWRLTKGAELGQHWPEPRKKLCKTDGAMEPNRGRAASGSRKVK
jgi:hypothetical protein